MMRIFFPAYTLLRRLYVKWIWFRCVPPTLLYSNIHFN